MFSKKLKPHLLQEDKKRLLSNFFSLSILQGANYILPLITLPYLVRVLGPANYGLVAFATAFIGYFTMLTDYGFNLSATREISINRDDNKKISEIFFSVMAVKVLLSLASLVIMAAAVMIFHKFDKNWPLYFITFGIVIGTVLFPVWFFQGMEKMRPITILNLISRFIYTVCIFVFIRKPSNYIYVPLIISIGQIVAGILAIRIIIVDFKVKLFLPKIKDIRYELVEGWHIFLSTVAISLYTTSNVFILGLFANTAIVGYYAAAEKIVRALQNLLSPAFTTIYPHISKLADESKTRALRFIRKAVLLIGSFYFLVSLTTFIFAYFVVTILLGSQYTESVVILRILAFLPFIIGLSNIFGIQTMLTFNYKKAYSNIYIIAGILNIVLVFTLVVMYNAIGISIAVLITESFVAISMLVFLYYKGIKIFSGEVIPQKF